MRGDPAEEDAPPGMLQSALAALGMGGGGGGGRREREGLLPLTDAPRPARALRARRRRRDGAKPAAPPAAPRGDAAARLPLHLLQALLKRAARLGGCEAPC